VQPSEADHRLTCDLLTACRPLGLVVLDHVIVTDAACFSFADHGLLDE
jgi:DNA repair protein RadC